MASEVVDSVSFFLAIRPNRSLSPNGRQLWFGLIACGTFFSACAATAIGAWLVLPFAGIEVLFLWLAFRWIARHDEDYECVQVEDREFYWARRECGQVEVLRGNAAWTQVFAVARNGRVEIGLRYQGRTVSVGQWMSDQQRKLLCRDLARVLK